MTPTIVTGAGRGIGAAIARKTALRGWPVGVLDVDATSAAAVAEDINASGGTAVALVASTTDERTLEAEIARFHGLFGVPRLLVNNAGIVRFGPLLDLPADDFRAVVEVLPNPVYECPTPRLRLPQRSTRDRQQERYSALRTQGKPYA